MSEGEKEKDVSCFEVDGVVAEMVIEVEDNQKTGLEDFRDIMSDKKGEDHNIDLSNEVEESEVVTSKKEDKENLIEISVPSENENLEDVELNKVKDKTSAPTSKRKRKNELIASNTENKDIDMQRYPGKTTLEYFSVLTIYL